MKKANLNKATTTLLSVPTSTDDLVSLLGVSKDNKFLYEVTYIVDQGAALRRLASTVRIKVLRGPEIRSGGGTLFSNWDKDPEGSLTQLLTRAGTQKGKSRAEADNVLMEVLSDFTSKVSNDSTTRITKPKGEERGGGQPTLARKTTGDTTTTPVTAGSLRQGNTKVPVYVTNVHKETNPEVPKADTVSIARVASTLLSRRRVDPAEVVGAKTNNVVPARNVIGGVSSGNKTPRTSFLSPAQRATVIDSILGENLGPRTLDDLDPDDVVVVPILPPGGGVGSLEVTETIRIPSSLVGESDFYLSFELVDRVGILVQRVEAFVPHSKLLAKFDVVTKPPLVRVQPSPAPNRTVLHISQRDSGAAGVHIYRKDFPPSRPNLDSKYTFLEKVACTGVSPVVFVDEGGNENPVSYRVVPYDRGGTLSGEFTGVVTPAVHSSRRIKVETIGSRPTFASLVGEVDDTTGVTLLARGIPVEVVAVQVLRRNLTQHERVWTRIGDVVQIPGQGSAPLVLKDTTTKTGNVYLFGLRFIYKDGSDAVSSGTAFIDNTPVTANLVITTLTNPTTTVSGPDLDVEFQMRTELVPTNLDLVNQAIKNQDLLLYFREEIESRRKDLQGIVCYQVNRVNLTTGEVEGFQPTVNRTFSDRQYGPLNNVSPLVPGHEYQYVVYTWFRDTETMLEDLARDVETTKGGITQTYSLTPSKWYHPITLSKGNLVSESSIQRNYGVTQFQLGTLGSVARTPVLSLAEVLPVVETAQASRFTKDTAWVSWTISGNPEKFDHFLVCAITSGIRTVVGKCHNITDSNLFQFVDERPKGDHSSLVYEITPVYYDQTRGNPVLTSKIAM